MRTGVSNVVGHMRTNKACPMHSGSDKPSSSNITFAEEQEDEFEKTLNTDDEDLVNVDGTKVTLSSKLIKHAEEIKRRALVLKVPKDAFKNKKRKPTSDLHCDYLKRQQRPANRRRTDPVVVLSTLLESILNEMRDLPDVQPFLFPVNAKAVPDYYKIVHRPMDLQTIRENLRQKKYQSREEFLADVNQIVENSTLYNGGKSSLTMAAKKMFSVCVDRFGEKEEKLMRLEKAINPLLDDNDQVALTFILENVLSSKLKTMSESWPFAKPVNKKVVKDYYSVVKEPMDLETIENRVKNHKYHSRKDFIDDIEKILKNCVLYNGNESTFTMKAEALLIAAKQTLEEYDEHLTQLEQRISLVQERALEQAEMDTLDNWLGHDEDTQDQMRSGLDDFDYSKMDSVDFKKEPGVLEEDLQFSSEEDQELEEVTEYALPDDDSQQVAEAMVQLGNIAYYPETHPDESIDVDPNYDPSDFLGGLKRVEPVPHDEMDSTKIHDDLAVSESDEDMPMEEINQEIHILQEPMADPLAPQFQVEQLHGADDQQEEEDSGLWF